MSFLTIIKNKVIEKEPLQSLPIKYFKRDFSSLGDFFDFLKTIDAYFDMRSDEGSASIIIKVMQKNTGQLRPIPTVIFERKFESFVEMEECIVSKQKEEYLETE